jgi:hypothetical protein
MIRAQDAKAMTPQERVDALFDLQKQLYGVPGFGTVIQMAEVLEVHPQTIYKWKRTPESMPLSALLAVIALAESEDVRRTQLARVLCDDLDAVAQALSVTADRLASIARSCQTVARANLPAPASPPEPAA